SRARLPTVAAPGFVSRLSRPRNGPTTPGQFPGLSVVSVEEATNARFAAADSHDDLSVDRQRRGGDRMSGRVIFDLRLPPDCAGLRVERNQVTIERADIDGVVQNRHAAIRLAKADCFNESRDVAPPRPERSPRARVERGDDGRRLADVHHAV